MLNKELRGGECMSSPISVKAEVKADLTETIQSVPKGLGRVWDLITGVKGANIERYKSLLAAQTDIDIQDIKDRKTVYDPQSKQLFLTTQGFKEQLCEVMKDEETANLWACILKASKYVKEEETENKPSQDFINRWRNEAKLIHSEELQNIWARLLSEEVNQPESISLRTLDFVKNISKKEAELFTCYLTYVVNGGNGIVFCKNWKSGKFGIDIDKQEYVIDLESLRILKGAGFIMASPLEGMHYFNWPIKNDNFYYFIATNYHFFVSMNELKEQPCLYVALLSQPAQEIYQILRLDRNNREYKQQDIIDFINIIKTELLNCGANSVHCAYINPITNKLENYQEYSLLDHLAKT